MNNFEEINKKINEKERSCSVSWYLINSDSDFCSDIHHPWYMETEK
jgi:hypothetical protein